VPIDPSDLLVGQITAEEITEFIHPPVSPRRDALTVGSADLEMHFKIPGDKLKAAVQFILGVDYVDYDLNLRRSLPMFHPFWCWNFAKQINVQGQVYDRDDVESVVWDFQVTPAAWKQYEAIVTFDQSPFPIYADDEVDTETERFLSKFWAPDSKVVTVDNGQVVYYNASGKPFDQQPRSATIPIARREGAGLKVIWHRVPADFIQPDDDTLPIKYAHAKGKVNDAPLFGCAPETLLLLDVKMDDKYPCPLMTDQVGKLSFLYRLEFDFLYVNQLTSQMGDSAETLRGHNCLLGPELAYWPTRSVAGGGRKIFQPIAMEKLFTNYTDEIN
jgi:hypothetical protein